VELFSILCDTCASKLRVTKPNAVGQVLACPKCANMIRIVPPPGWEPSVETVNQLSSEQLDKIRASISSAGFEDIDDLLQSTPLPTKKPQPVRQTAADAGNKKSNTQKKPLAAPSPAKPANRSNPSTPVLPTNEWTSQQSQQRRKWLLIFSATLGTIIIVCGLVGAYFANASRKTTEKLATSDPAPSVVDEPETARDGSPTTEDDLPETTDPEVSTTDNPESTPDVGDVDSATPVVTDPPSKVVSEDVPAPPESIETTAGDNTKPPNDLAKPPSNPLASLPTEPEKVEKTDDIIARDVLGNPTGDDSNLGSLSELLDQANTSITEISDLASEIQDQETIGISKYFIDLPEQTEFLVDKKLALPCGGLIAEKTPLIVVLRSITAITGVPFAFDIENLSAANFDFSLSTNINMQQSEDDRIDFAMAVDEAISQHKLTRSQTPDTGVVVLTAIDINEQTTADYQLPEFAANPVLGANMVVLVRKLIAPDTWTRKNSPGTIELMGDKVSVNQTPDVHLQLRQFFGKLRTIEAGEPVLSHWEAAQSALAKSANLKRSLPLTLEELLSNIQLNTDVVVLIDWPELAKEGWNPMTIVPGNIIEESVYQTLKEIARSMKLTLRAVDNATIELTTFRAVANRPEIELFFYGDIIEGALKQEQVFEIVTQALGRQLRSNPNVRMEFFPQINCIVSVAPQTLQRQLELVLNKLRKIGR